MRKVHQAKSFRWFTVTAPGASTSVALIAGPDTGADTGIRFLVPDAETEHAASPAPAAGGRGPFSRLAAGLLPASWSG